MTEPKHTKGPWTSSLMDYHSEDPTVIAISGSDNNVCEILDGSVEDADLALILAAPDMYEALEFQCKNCLGRYSISKDSNECALYIREECMIAKALRKARGETE